MTDDTEPYDKSAAWDKLLELLSQYQHQPGAYKQIREFQDMMERAKEKEEDGRE